MSWVSFYAGFLDYTDPAPAPSPAPAICSTVMLPPVFQILNSTPDVKALLGSKPLRLFPWGEAPEKVIKPYATYGVFNGNPENYLDRVPDIDNLGTQIDIWATTGKSCQDCFLAIRCALEPKAHMVSFQATSRDPETKLYTARMEFDFWTLR